MSNLSTTHHLIILPELETLIPPLEEEELKLLQESIEVYGCRESLIVWNRAEEGDLVLIDGHNRHRICKELGIDFNINQMEFDSLVTAREWMIENQLGRRNLTATQASYLRGIRYNYEKRGRGGFGQVLSKGQTLPTTAKAISMEYGVSEKTVKRDAQFAKGVEKIGSINPQLKQDILAGKAKVSKSAIQKLSRYNNAVFDLHTPQDIAKVVKEFSEDVKANPVTPIDPIARIPKNKIPKAQEEMDVELDLLQKQAIELMNQYLQWLGRQNSYSKPCASATTSVKVESSDKFDYSIRFDVEHFPMFWINDLPVNLYHVGLSSIAFEVVQKDYLGLIKCIEHAMRQTKINDHVLYLVQQDLYHSIIKILALYDEDELAEQLGMSSSKLFERLSNGDLSINQLRHVCEYMNHAPSKLDNQV